MSNDINPGQQAPWTIPFCASCKSGVEEFTIHPLNRPGAVDIESKCHGKTEGVRLTAAEVARIKLSGEPLIMFKGPLRNLVDAVVRG